MVKFKKSHLGLIAAALGVLSGCGAEADTGPNDGAGGFPVYTGAGGGGGFPPGSGGFVQGSGGFVQGSGGFVQGSGGFVQGSGGLVGSTGGFVGSTGGVIGAGGALTTGGTTGAGGAGPGLKPKCLTKGSQVITIGDSYINWASHTFPADLNKEAAQTFRPTYAIGGMSMATGGIPLGPPPGVAFIPDQFPYAYKADPDIVAVVFDGGGNDVLIPAATYAQGAQCKNSADSANVADCKAIVQAALDASTKMVQAISDKGIRDVVYFFYPHVPEGTAIGGAHPNAILDYSMPKARDLCATAESVTGGKTRCHFVDMIPVFQGQSNVFAPGDIHPNGAGSALMAKAVWAKMKENCVAQPASSGCCEP